MAISPSLHLRQLELERTRINVILQSAILNGRGAIQLSPPPEDPRQAEPFSVALRPDEMQARANILAKIEAQIHQVLQEARQMGHTLPLEHLVSIFGLDPFEKDVLLLCLAPALDVHYGEIYASLQGNKVRTWPSVDLILNLLCEPGMERWLKLSSFTEERPLLFYQLLEMVPESDPNPVSLLCRSFAPNSTLVDWIVGAYQPQRCLSEGLTLWVPPNDEEEELLTRQLWPALAGVEQLSAEADQPPLVGFHGPDHDCQVALAQRLATHLNRSLLVVDLMDSNPPKKFDSLVQVALRDARLMGAIPFFLGWDVALDEDRVAYVSLMEHLCTYPDWIILAGRIAWSTRGFERKRRLIQIECPLPNYLQRQALWNHLLERLAPSLRDLETMRGEDVSLLVTQFQLSTAQIRDAVATARDWAIQHGRSIQPSDLLAAARSQSTSRLPDMAKKIVPRHSWEDIILPPDSIALLQEMIDSIRLRGPVLEGWKLAEKLAASRGIAALFAGPPGTGKTMAAEVIAHELGLDLYRIDLSRIISKYVGETEKNLERVFNEAQSSNIVLFFDEADSLFGKRTEVKSSNDRYANVSVSYLLQRMESYDGLTIMATNLRANLDEAFLRRMQFVLNFPFPDETERLHIWHRLFPPGVPRASNLNLRFMAQRFKLAGGNIRNIIAGAAYLAAAEKGEVTMRHLLHATRRELQKMGRLGSEQDHGYDPVNAQGA